MEIFLVLIIAVLVWFIWALLRPKKPTTTLPVVYDWKNCPRRGTRAHLRNEWQKPFK